MTSQKTTHPNGNSAESTTECTAENTTGDVTQKFSVASMSCASCVGRVDRALAALDGVKEVNVNLASETATVTFGAPITTQTIVDTLENTGYPARTDKTTLRISSMSCASCVGRVERALMSANGVVSANVNLASETATIVYLAGETTPTALAQIATNAGYAAQTPDAETGTKIGNTIGTNATDMHARKSAEFAALLRLTLLAAALALPVFILEMGGHIFPAFHHFIARTIGTQNSWLIQFALTTLVLIGPGRRFYTAGIPALFKGAPEMNSLVALGTSSAYAFSVVATFLPTLLPNGTRAVYYESAAVIVVLILLGRTLEARAKGRTGAAIRALLTLRAPTANIIRDGEIVEINSDDIAVGDTIIVRPGERIATDGEITEGRSNIDESMITGEPIAIAKTIGAPVTGGTLNTTGSFQFRATRIGADTTLAQIMRMVEDAQGAKLPIQGIVDKITMWFVPAVMALAALTIAAWLAFSPAPALGHALVAGVAVLIIACPCAMGLATPTSIMVGTGRAAQMGVLFRRGDALQSLQSIDIIAFDKTGTLTAGTPALTDFIAANGHSRDGLLRLIGAVQKLSEHPIAQTIAAAAQAEYPVLPKPENFIAVPGMGVRATVEGHDILIGADRFMVHENIDIGDLAAPARALATKGKTPIYVAQNGKIAAFIAVSDPIKPTTKPAIAALREQGLKIAMITGDNAATANAIAAQIGIDHVIAEVRPEGKVAALQSLVSNNDTDPTATTAKIAFVGDGINDAPALAHADVGIAIGTGTDIAIETADVVLMSGDIAGVVNAFHISSRTMRNIRQNLFWAFAYNIALIPVAAGVLYPLFGILLSPMLAAGAMALSSVFVLTNALRLRRVRAPQIDKGITG